MDNKKDILVATILLQEQNPNLNGDQYGQLMLHLGINNSNSQLLSREEYKTLPGILKKYNQEGIPRWDLFEKDYELALRSWNIINSEAADKVFTELLKNKDIEELEGAERPSLQITKVRNIGGITIGGGGFSEEVSKNRLSEREIAQANKFYDPETGKWSEKSLNDLSYIEKLSKNFNYAKYEKDDYYENPETGNLEFHHKGEFKRDKNGNTYCEVLHGSRAGKEVVSFFDILTDDGSAWNKIDFFDSDDVSKSITGTTIRSIALMAPYLFFGKKAKFGYTLAAALLNLTESFTTMYLAIASLSNSDPSEISDDVENFFAKFKFSMSDEARQKNTLFTFEGMANMATDTVGQLYLQRLMSKLPFLLKNYKFKKEYDYAIDAYSATRNVEYLKEADQLLSSYTKAQRSNWLRELGTLANLGYMSLVTVSDIYNQTKEFGFSDKDAAITTIAAALALYGITNFNARRFGFGKRFVEMTTGYDEEALIHLSDIRRINLAEINAWARQYVDKGLATESSKKSLLSLFKSLLSLYYKAINGAGGWFQSDIVGQFFNEAAEELSEEIIQDLVKAVVEWNAHNQGREGSFQMHLWENGKPGELGAKDFWRRYFETFVGGGIGGAIFAGVGNHFDPWFQKKFYNDVQTIDKNLRTAILLGYGDLIIEELKYNDFYRKAFNPNITLNGEPVIEGDPLPQNKPIVDIIIDGLVKRIEGYLDLYREITGRTDFYVTNTIENDLSEHLKSQYLNFIDKKGLDHIEKRYLDIMSDYAAAYDDYKSAKDRGESNELLRSLKLKYEEAKEKYNNFFSIENITNINKELLIRFNPALQRFLGNFTLEAYLLNKYNIEAPTEELKLIYQEEYDQYKAEHAGTLENPVIKAERTRELLDNIILKWTKDFCYGSPNFLYSLVNYGFNSDAAFLHTVEKLSERGFDQSDITDVSIFLNQSAGLGLRNINLAGLINSNKLAFVLNALFGYDTFSKLVDSNLIEVNNFDSEELKILKDWFNELVSRLGTVELNEAQLNHIVKYINDKINIKDRSIEAVRKLLELNRNNNSSQNNNDQLNTSASDAAIEAEWNKKNLEKNSNAPAGKILSDINIKKVLWLINEYKKRRTDWFGKLTRFISVKSNIIEDIKYYTEGDSNYKDNYNLKEILNLVENISEKISLEEAISKLIEIFRNSVEAKKDDEGNDIKQRIISHLETYIKHNTNNSNDNNFIALLELIDYNKKINNQLTNILVNVLGLIKNLFLKENEEKLIKLCYKILYGIDTTEEEYIEYKEGFDILDNPLTEFDEEVNTALGLLINAEENGQTGLQAISSLLSDDQLDILEYFEIDDENVKNILKDIMDNDDFVAPYGLISYSNQIKELIESVKEDAVETDPIFKLLSLVYYTLSDDETLEGRDVLKYLVSLLNVIRESNEIYDFSLSTHEFSLADDKTRGILHNIMRSIYIALTVLYAMKLADDPNLKDMPGYTNLTRNAILYGKTSQAEKKALNETIPVLNDDAYKMYMGQLDSLKGSILNLILIYFDNENRILRDAEKMYDLHVKLLNAKYKNWENYTSEIIKKILRNTFGTIGKKLDEEGINLEKLNYLIELEIYNQLLSELNGLDAQELKEFKEKWATALFNEFGKNALGPNYQAAAELDLTKDNIDYSINDNLFATKLLSLLNYSPEQFVKGFWPSLNENKIVPLIDQILGVREVIGFMDNIDAFKKYQELLYEDYLKKDKEYMNKHKDDPNFKLMFLPNTYKILGFTGSGKTAVICKFVALEAARRGKKVTLSGLKEGTINLLKDKILTTENSELVQTSNIDKYLEKFITEDDLKTAKDSYKELKANLKKISKKVIADLRSSDSETRSNAEKALKQAFIPKGKDKTTILIKRNENDSSDYILIFSGIEFIPDRGYINYNIDNIKITVKDDYKNSILIIDEASYIDPVKIKLLDAIQAKHESILILSGDPNLQAEEIFTFSDSSIDLDLSYYFTVPSVKLNNMYRAKYSINRDNYKLLSRTLYQLYSYGNLTPDKRSILNSIKPSEYAYSDDEYAIIKDVLSRDVNKLKYGFVVSNGIKPVGIQINNTLSAILPILKNRLSLGETMAIAINDGPESLILNKIEEVKQILQNNEFTDEDISKISILTASNIQGLEFNNVILYDIDHKDVSDDVNIKIKPGTNFDSSWRKAYTLGTRATDFTFIYLNKDNQNSLFDPSYIGILSEEDPHPTISSIDSELFTRLYEAFRDDLHNISGILSNLNDTQNELTTESETETETETKSEVELKNTESEPKLIELNLTDEDDDDTYNFDLKDENEELANDEDVKGIRTFFEKDGGAPILWNFYIRHGIVIDKLFEGYGDELIIDTFIQTIREEIDNKDSDHVKYIKSLNAIDDDLVSFIRYLYESGETRITKEKLINQFIRKRNELLYDNKNNTKIRIKIISGQNAENEEALSLIMNFVYGLELAKKAQVVILYLVPYEGENNETHYMTLFRFGSNANGKDTDPRFSTWLQTLWNAGNNKGVLTLEFNSNEENVNKAIDDIKNRDLFYRNLFRSWGGLVNKLKDFAKIGVIPITTMRLLKIQSDPKDNKHRRWGRVSVQELVEAGLEIHEIKTFSTKDAFTDWIKDFYIIKERITPEMYKGIWLEVGLPGMPNDVRFRVPLKVNLVDEDFISTLLVSLNTRIINTYSAKQILRALSLYFLNENIFKELQSVQTLNLLVLSEVITKEDVINWRNNFTNNILKLIEGINTFESPVNENGEKLISDENLEKLKKSLSNNIINPIKSLLLSGNGMYNVNENGKITKLANYNNKGFSTLSKENIEKHGKINGFNIWELLRWFGYKRSTKIPNSVDNLLNQNWVSSWAVEPPVFITNEKFLQKSEGIEVKEIEIVQDKQLNNKTDETKPQLLSNPIIIQNPVLSTTKRVGKRMKSNNTKSFNLEETVNAILNENSNTTVVKNAITELYNNQDELAQINNKNKLLKRLYEINDSSFYLTVQNVISDIIDKLKDLCK